MIVVRGVEDWREVLIEECGETRSLGLVPTMGALHEGHGALLDAARRRCSTVVASIFVNPIQFNQQKDYELYPQSLEDDIAYCAARGVDYIFAPSAEEMYPEPQRAFVDVEGLTEHLCGRYRPGHFRGVATVVLKLFQIVCPHVAFFGEKDYQQLAVIRRMVRDLNVPVEVAGVATVREFDGLALSSRNRRLSPEERSLAPRLYQALLEAQRLIASGETDAVRIKERAAAGFEDAPGVRLEYLDFVDPDTLEPVPTIAAPVRAAVAAWVGETRLIDNVLCEPMSEAKASVAG
jgi:pantoate--beta-alanine ligase